MLYSSRSFCILQLATDMSLFSIFYLTSSHVELSFTRVNYWGWFGSDLGPLSNTRWTFLQVKNLEFGRVLRSLKTLPSNHGSFSLKSFPFFVNLSFQYNFLSFISFPSPPQYVFSPFWPCISSLLLYPYEVTSHHLVAALSLLFGALFYQILSSRNVMMDKTWNWPFL